MGLETGTYINNLVATNPVGTDAKSAGDDHIRLIKATILATFPNITGAVTPTHTELNFVDGVTSAIQTQLDAKQAAGSYQPLDAQLTTLAGITAQQATDLASVSTFIGTLLNDADAAVARATLKMQAIMPVGASVAANALTLTLNACVLDFRDATLTSGTINTRSVASPISVVVSSGSTLGTVNATAARLAILAIDNAGTVELAVSNLSGGVNLDETTLISTTAEGGAGAADSATAIYSTTARTNVPFRVVGFIDITEATAGTWATAPTLVQGAGGQSLAPSTTLKVSANDTTPGYLNGKLVAGTNVTLTEGSDGANETLTIAASGGVSTDVGYGTSAAVGTLAFMQNTGASVSGLGGTTTSVIWGYTAAGALSGGGTVSGTWRNLASVAIGTNEFGPFQRIA